MKPSNLFRPPPARQAAIHSITAHPRLRSSVPVRPDDREADSTSSPSPMAERLAFTVDEAAYLLNISRNLVCELVDRGELPAIRLGRRIVIPRVVLEELLGAVIC